jgi:hypothetical protein
MVTRLLTASRAAALVVLSAGAAPAGTKWPLMPPDEDHPIGNTFGEYVRSGSEPPEQHLGLDILGKAGFKDDGTWDTTAPFSFTVQEGEIVTLINDRYASASSTDLYLYNQVEILGDGKLYRYLHHAYNGFHPDFVEWYEEEGSVPEGVPICLLVRWPDCDPPYNHLHFEVRNGSDNTEVLNPNTGFLDADYKAPTCEEILFAKDESTSGRWVEFAPGACGASTVVSGKVDIVAKARDQNAAGSTHPATQTLWVKNVRWKVCPEATPLCTSWKNTYVFDSMPEEWGETDNAATKAYFSSDDMWQSSRDYCGGDPHYAVVTNFKAGVSGPTKSESWDTTSLSSGSYTVTVELTDFADNSDTFNARVLVENPPAGSTKELTIRDGEKDRGAVPFLGGNWWESPDITVKPGSALEDKILFIGVSNKIDVRVWNYGSATLTAGTYKVSLGWSPPAASIPHPLVAPAKLIETQTVTISAAFSPGSSQTTTFEWIPNEAEVSDGSHSLVAWVDLEGSDGDPVMDTPSVRLDDNRAQQNVNFVHITTSPAAFSLWLYDMPGAQERSMDFRFRHSALEPSVEEFRLHVPPGLSIGSFLGGRYAGTYPEQKDFPPDWKSVDGAAETFMDWEDARKQRRTVVITDIDPEGRLRLTDLRLQKDVKAARLQLEALPRMGLPAGRFTDVEVSERASFQGSPRFQVGGATARFVHGAGQRD